MGTPPPPNVITKPHTLPSLRMTGATPILPHVPSWGADEQQLYYNLYPNENKYWLPNRLTVVSKITHKGSRRIRYNDHLVGLARESAIWMTFTLHYLNTISRIHNLWNWKSVRWESGLYDFCRGLHIHCLQQYFLRFTDLRPYIFTAWGIVHYRDGASVGFCIFVHCYMYEGWSFNSGNYLFTTDTK